MIMVPRRWSSILLSLTLILGAASTAHAEAPDPEKRAAAQALFDAARKLTGQERFAEACPKLLESYRLDPAIGTKFYLAECYERTGRLASAWTYYLEVVEQARAESAKDREKFATQRAEALKARLPRLVVRRSAAAQGLAGLAVQRDGVPIGDGTWDTPVPVDLGKHTIQATAPGKKLLELPIEVSQEGAEVVVEIPALEAVPVAPSPEVAPVPPPPPPPPRPVSSAQRIAGFAVGGAGVVGLGAGLGLGALALSKKSASNSGGNCSTTDLCNAAGHQLRIEGIQAAAASTALVAVGSAAVVAGVVLVATAPSSKAKPADAPSASLTLGPLGAWIRGRF